ncbi:hypothetical protein E4U53_000873 [Claviceps sorghi]|nr:hypothetical protein E4U53_000873 [Claviceps sorghi]
MRFSTSAVLAAIALCPGQTFAECLPGEPPSDLTQTPCEANSDTVGFLCGRVNKRVFVSQSGNSFDVLRVRRRMAFRAYCVNHHNIFVTVTCDANTNNGKFSVDCPAGDTASLDSWQE